MAKKTASTTTLPFDYFVVKCKLPKGQMALGLLGALHITNNATGLLLITSAPRKKIVGIDDFEMKLVSAVPEALHNDVKELTQKNMSTSDLLVEVARRYSGTVFAERQMQTGFLLHFSDAEKPEKFMSKIVEEGTRLAMREFGVIPAISHRQHAKSAVGRKQTTTTSAIKRMRNAVAPMGSYFVMC